MPEMICKTALDYPPGKTWKPGERFEVEEAHVELLKATGHAEPATGWDGWPTSAPKKTRRQRAN